MTYAHESLRQRRRRRDRELLTRIASILVQTLAVIAFAAIFAFVAVEWAAGCGEVTYYPDHTWRTNECVFMDREQKSGTW